MFKKSDYIFLKALIPRRLQIIIRRELIRRQLRHVRNTWPIDEAACKPPERWQGWPHGKKFALVLTHDVERKSGLEKCRQLMELEEELGFRSSFGFVAGDYKVPNELLLSLENRGFEAYIHGLYHDNNPFRSKEVFNKQAAEINSYLKKWNAVGFRSPSMYHNLDLTHGLDIEYDASTFDTDPFEPQPDGMRTIFPFWVPGNVRQKGYVELPYTLPQDFLLFILMREQNIDIWKKKLDWIAKHGGMALIITHPDYMNTNDAEQKYDEYPISYYEEFLQYVRDRYKGQFWNVLPKGITRWWTGQPKSNTMPIGMLPSRRICMLVYSFYESDNRVLRYAETLIKRGDTVDVIALRKDGQDSRGQLRGANIFRIQRRVKNERTRLSYLYRLSAFFAKAFILLTIQHIRKPYKLIHVHNMPDFLVFAALLPKLFGARVILDIHDVVPELYATQFNKNTASPLFKGLLLVERISAAFADHVIIANHIWHKTVIARSVEERKCSVIMNYPDENVFFKRPKTRTDNKFIMIYPGSLTWRQGVDIAVKACGIIKDKASFEFHVYGEGKSTDYLRELIDKLQLQDVVFLKDTLPIFEIAEKMANADLGIEPKRNDLFAGDAMSTKILEFMSLGIPLIVSDTRIHKYYFKDSAARFFKSGDEKDLASGMLQLLSDAGHRTEMASKNSQFVEDFVWSKKEEDYLKLMDRIIQHNNE